MNKIGQTVLVALVLTGCVGPLSSSPITNEEAISIATAELTRRNVLPLKYEQHAKWSQNHWVVGIQKIAGYDHDGRALHSPGSDNWVLLSPKGELLAILGRSNASRDEIMRWENNLRRLHHNEQMKQESQPSVSPYSGAAAGTLEGDR